MPSTTSAARRKPTCTFGFSTGGRPRLFQDRYCSGNASLNGLARAKSASVHSGLSSSSAIASPLPFIGPSQRDGAHGFAAHGEGQHAEAISDHPGSQPPRFPVIASVILADRRRLEVHLRRRSQGNAV